ncbi:Transcriptional regulator, HxlR family [Acidisarcina polymorpha]|uniref:Transcriptional regulator, HxlR family n=2 Tax=Acidisarcina polymorpha TaxID=2211140 RepID=A0A2Z5FSR3_9BACT|nr:Transcriptional regulator, HxlR family [Acidisarcina polymorpha]
MNAPAKKKKIQRQSRYPETTPEVDRIVREIIGRLADKWTMLILENLEEYGRARFTVLSQRIGDVSQKMLTKTLRQMESDGLVKRTVFPVVPPRVEYELTELGEGLTAAFCGVWIWAEANHDKIEAARVAFQKVKQENTSGL